MPATMTIRLESELKQRLDRLSEAMQRPKSSLAKEAIEVFVDLNEWQLGEIEKAVAEADRDEFARDELVGEVFGKWGTGADWMARHGIAESSGLV